MGDCPQAVAGCSFEKGDVSSGFNEALHGLRRRREEVLTLGIELPWQDVEFQEGAMVRGVGRTFLSLRGRSSRFFLRNHGMAQMSRRHDRMSEDKKKIHRENAERFLAKL